MKQTLQPLKPPRQDIDLAIDCIEWSCKAVLETPSLKLEPLLALSFRGLVDLASAATAAMILTSDLQNDEVRQREYHWIIPQQSAEQIAMLAAVAFWCLWTNFIITAISDFASWRIGLAFYGPRGQFGIGDFEKPEKTS